MFDLRNEFRSVWDQQTKRWIQNMTKAEIEENIPRWQFEVDNQCFGYEETIKWVKMAKQVLREKSYKVETYEEEKCNGWYF